MASRQTPRLNQEEVEALRIAHEGAQSEYEQARQRYKELSEVQRRTGERLPEMDSAVECWTQAMQAAEKTGWAYRRAAFNAQTNAEPASVVLQPDAEDSVSPASETRPRPRRETRSASHVREPRRRRVKAEENPFRALMQQRTQDSNPVKPAGFFAAILGSFGSRRRAAREWRHAWPELTSNDSEEYNLGLEAWYPMRERMPAAEFITRYVLPES
jgi:hypothetical protein